MRKSLLALTLLALCAAPAAARDYLIGGLKISDPWSRPAAQGMTGVGYVTITNTGARPETLLGASSKSRKTELHESMMTGGIHAMKALPKGLTIAPGQTVKLEPNGYHLMFIGLAQATALGGRLPATLNFARAGKVEIDFAVRTGPAETHRH